jgi:hypothetical protein
MVDADRVKSRLPSLLVNGSTTKEEKLSLIESGFEFVSSNPDGTQYFRKRK